MLLKTVLHRNCGSVTGAAAMALVLLTTAAVAPCGQAQTTLSSPAASIGVGTAPYAMAVNPVTGKVYVANLFSNTVSVIDEATNTVAATVTVGTRPSEVAVNPVTGQVYVVNPGSNTVSVIDGATNTVVATVPVGSEPIAVAVNAVTRKVYVANESSYTVSVIDGTTNTVAATVAVGAYPSAVAVNAVTGQVYVVNQSGDVANRAGDSVSVIDGANNTVSATVPVGSEPDAVAVNAVTGRVYVANYDSGTVSVIDGATNTVATTVTVEGGPVAVAVNAVTGKVYVANGSGTVSVIDSANNTVAATITVGTGPNAVAVNAVTGQVYVVNLSSNTVSVIDGANNTAADTINVGTTPRAVAVNPVTGQVYVANQESNTVSVIDGANNVAATTVTVGYNPYAVGANPVTGQVYVANIVSNTVSVIDGTTNKVAATVTVGSNPYDVAVNAVTGQVYVANQANDTVSVIDGTTNKVAATVKVGSESEAVAVNAVTGKVYVTNNFDNNVSVIDGTTNKVAATVKVGIGPDAVAVNAVTGQIYVANAGGNTVSVIDGATNTVAATVSVGSYPYAVAVNPVTGKVYVANYGGNNVSVINGATNTVAATFTVGNEPEGVAVNAVTGQVYVANAGSDTVSVIDGTTNTVAATVSVGTVPDGVAVNAVTGQVYVTNYLSNTVSVIGGQGTQGVPIGITTQASATVPSPYTSAASTATTPYITTYPAPSFTATATSSYASTAAYSGVASAVNPPLTALYYWLDDGSMSSWQYVAPSSIAGSNPATFPIALSGKKPGFYNLYMFAAYGNEGTPWSSSNGTGNSPEISAVTAYPFYLSPIATTTTVQADVNPQQPNQNVTLTAIVTPAATGAVADPTGTVNFYDGTTLLNTTPVTITTQVNGSEEASFQTSFTTTGAHSITAVFTTGDMNYFGSTSVALTETIGSTPTVTGITPASGPAAGGTVVTITGTNLTGATGVSFGGEPATSFTVVSATTMTVTSPAGTGTVDIVVTNPSASSATSPADRFTYTAPAITVSPTTLPGGTYGAAYTQAITASGGTAPYTFSVTAGALPTGLTLSSAGVLSGTPTADGTFNFTVTTTDKNNFIGNQAYSLTVTAPTITISPASLPTATAETAYSQIFTASGGTAPYAYAVSAGALPAGLTLNAATGTLSGTPTAAGAFDFTVRATDSSTGVGAPFSTTRNYALTVTAPTITVTPATLPGATVGIAYAGVMFGATGGTASYAYSISAGALPQGLTLSSAGALSGTPIAGGTFNFTVTATDKNGFTANQAYALIVNAPTLSLSPVSGTKLTATAETAFSQMFVASGGISPYTYTESGTLPSGITFNPVTATLSGTPTQTGSFPITISAKDSSQGNGPFMVIGNYTLTVSGPTISVTPATLPGATAGIAYAGVMFGATGGMGSYAYSISAGALPAGLTLSSAGALSGTPTAGGAFNFTVTATDANNFTGNHGYVLTVSAPALTLSPASLPTATAEAAYSQTFTASGGTAPYTYEILSGTLPAGLSLSAAGVLSGTPTAAGPFNFTVKAIDSSTGTGAPYATTRNYALTVTAPAIVVTPSTLPNAAFDVAYSQTLHASGGTGTYTYSSTAGALPAGVTLSGSGVISGTPTTSGNFSFTVTAKDGDGFTGAEPYSLTVIAPTVTISPATLPAATVGVAYSATLTAAGGTTPYTFNAGTLPAGLTLSSTGLLSGTPTAGGTFSIAVTATDSSASPGPYKGTAAYSLTVNAGTATLSFSAVPAQTYGNPPFTVSASSASTGAITYSVVSGPATVIAGSGLVTLTGAGTVVLQASQAATASYSSATAQTTVNVAKQASVTSVSAAPAVATPVQTVTLTATVSAAVAGTPTSPTGTVIFLDNGVPLGTAVNVAHGAAQLVVPGLPAGATAAITATYQGDNNFLGSTSSTTATVVVAPFDFTFTNTGTSAYTAAPGAMATYSFGLAPLYGSYAAPVSFSVTGLPTGATASFTPGTVTVGAGATPVVMTVQTAAAIAHNPKRSRPFGREIVLAFLLLPFVARRRVREKLKGRMLLQVLLMAGLTATLTGCGSGNGFLLQSPQTYTLTVTATSGTLTHSQTVTLIVQ